MRVTILMDVRGSAGDVSVAVERALDAGVLQDAINECIDTSCTVESAVVGGMEARATEATAGDAPREFPELTACERCGGPDVSAEGPGPHLCLLCGAGTSMPASQSEPINARVQSLAELEAAREVVGELREDVGADDPEGMVNISPRLLFALDAEVQRLEAAHAQEMTLHTAALQDVERLREQLIEDRVLAATTERTLSRCSAMLARVDALIAAADRSDDARINVELIRGALRHA